MQLKISLRVQWSNESHVHFVSKSENSYFTYISFIIGKNDTVTIILHGKF